MNLQFTAPFENDEQVEMISETAASLSTLTIESVNEDKLLKSVVTAAFTEVKDGEGKESAQFHTSYQAAFRVSTVQNSWYVFVKSGVTVDVTSETDHGSAELSANEVEAGTAVFQGLEFTTRKAKVVEGKQEVKIPISWGDAPSGYDGTVTAEKSEFTAFGTISSDDYTIALDNQEIWVTVCMGIQQKQESGQTLQMIWDRFCSADCIRLWIC